MFLFSTFPSFHKPLGKIAAHLDEECSGAHCEVTGFQFEDFPGRFELPFRLWFAFCRADVNQRLQGMLDDGFSEASRRVMSAGAAPGAAPRHIQTALRNDLELIEAVNA